MLSLSASIKSQDRTAQTAAANQNAAKARTLKAHDANDKRTLSDSGQRTFAFRRRHPAARCPGTWSSSMMDEAGVPASHELPPPPGPLKIVSAEHCTAVSRMETRSSTDLYIGTTILLASASLNGGGDSDSRPAGIILRSPPRARGRGGAGGGPRAGRGAKLTLGFRRNEDRRKLRSCASGGGYSPLPPKPPCPTLGGL